MRVRSDVVTWAGRHWKPIALGAGILLMAGVYQGVWIMRPDWFRVEADNNVRPVDLFEKAWGFDDRSGVLQANPDLPAASARLRALYDELQVATVKLAADKGELEARQRAEGPMYKAFEASMMAQSEAYVAERVAIYEPQIKRLKAKMTLLEAQAGAKSGDDMRPGPLAVRRSRLELEAARLRLAQAEANAQARDYVVHNFAEFQKQPEQRAYLVEAHKTEALESTVRREIYGLSGYNLKLYNAFQAYADAARSKLNFWDFLYFSIGGATTATFGDISPNHTIVRMLFSGQIIFSIVLVSLWLNDLTRDRRSGAG